MAIRWAPVGKVPADLGPGKAFWTERLVAAPVKAVLKAGWEKKNGYLHSPLLCDRDFGLVTDPADDEF